MKTLYRLTLLGITALVCSCAVQPYHAEINNFDGLIKINPNDVRECESYARLNAQPEYTLERDLAYGAVSGFFVWCLGQYRSNRIFIDWHNDGLQHRH